MYRGSEEEKCTMKCSENLLNTRNLLLDIPDCHGGEVSFSDHTLLVISRIFGWKVLGPETPPFALSILGLAHPCLIAQIIGCYSRWSETKYSTHIWMPQFIEQKMLFMDGRKVGEGKACYFMRLCKSSPRVTLSQLKFSKNSFQKYFLCCPIIFISWTVYVLVFFACWDFELMLFLWN